MESGSERKDLSDSSLLRIQSRDSQVQLPRTTLSGEAFSLDKKLAVIYISSIETDSYVGQEGGQNGRRNRGINL